MQDIDYGTFLPGPPTVNPGRKLLMDTFVALAKARQDREEREMEDARLRRANDLTFQSSMYGHDVTKSHNEATEKGLNEQRIETGRHNRATEGNTAADREQRRQDAIAKFLADPKFVEALRSGDENALSPYLPALQAHGITPEDFSAPAPTPAAAPEQPAQPSTGPASAAPSPTEPAPLTRAEAEGELMQPQGPAPVTGDDVDQMNEVMANYQPSTTQRFKGPGGLAFGFDPVTNALSRNKLAAKTSADVTAASSSMGPYGQEGGRDAAQLAKLYVANGMSPIDAAKLAGEQAVTLAGQASARRNADVAGARGAARAGQGADRLELSKGTYAWDKASKVLQQFGAKELILQDRKYADMLASLTTNPNAALDAAAAGQWVKLAQGGTGVISDSDMETFWHKIGGVGTKVEGKIQELINGQIASGKRQVVAEAMQWLASRARSNLANIKGNLRTAMENDPNVTPEMRTAILRTFGAEPSKAEAAANALLNKYGVK